LERGKDENSSVSREVFKTEVPRRPGPVRMAGEGWKSDSATTETGGSSERDRGEKKSEKERGLEL